MWFSETCYFFSVLFCKIYPCYNIDCIPLYNRVYLFIFLLIDIQVISFFFGRLKRTAMKIHENVQVFLEVVLLGHKVGKCLPYEIELNDFLEQLYY